jgi:hypothetical protein
MVLTAKRWGEWKMDKVISELVSILREILKLKKVVWKGEEVDPKYFYDLTNLLDRCEQRGLTGEFNEDKLSFGVNEFLGMTLNEKMLRLEVAHEKMREDMMKELLSVKKSVGSLFKVKDLILIILLLVVLFKQFL